MKKICKIVVALLCAIGPSAAYAQLTTITASHINIGGVPIAAGTVTFTPINSQGTPIPFAQGGGGLNAPTAFSCTITTGAISGSCQIPDSALTVPANIGYRVQITNTATNLAFTLPNVLGVTGTTWALDAYGPPAPTSNVQAVQGGYGPTAPDSCVEPSTYTTYGGAFYICVSSVFVQIGGGVTAANMQAALAGETGCATAGYVWQPQSNTCVAQSGGSVTSTNVQAAISPLSGCNTSGYLWSPQSNTCISAGGTGTVTHTAGALTSGYLLIGNGGADSKVDTGCHTDGAGNLTCASYNTSSTAPQSVSLAAGSGNIPALPANSAGFAAPVTGGTSYLFKPPSTITAGILEAAAPATGDGVNESALSVVAAPTSAIVGISDTQTLTNKTLDGVTPATMAYIDAASSIQTQLNGKQPAIATSITTLTDSSSVTWAIGSAQFATSSLTLIHTTSTRALNLTGLVTNGDYVVYLKQDSTGGALLTLGTGCTWKISGGGGGAITLSTGASKIDVLAFTYDGTNCYGNLNTNFN